jgi:hypothetical protein
MRKVQTGVLALIVGVFATSASQGGVGDSVSIDKYSAKVPAGWKQEEPSNKMRLTQFRLPGGDGDAELAVFFFAGNAGSVKDNLERQVKKFKNPKAEVSKTKFGPLEATFQDVQGTFLSKFPPFDPNAKVTEKAEWRQLYVIFETDKGQYYMTLLGPAKTVEKHKDTFEKWLTSFK